MNVMKKMAGIALLAALVMSTAGCARFGRGCTQCQMSRGKDFKRIGMVVGIRPEVIPEYKRLHAADNAGVRDLLTKYNMHNFSIYLHKIDGKWYEFGYYEYTGDDEEADMAKLDAEPRNKEWLKVCDPMQVPLEGETGWVRMEEVYHND